MAGLANGVQTLRGVYLAKFFAKQAPLLLLFLKGNYLRIKYKEGI